MIHAFDLHLDCSRPDPATTLASTHLPTDTHGAETNPAIEGLSGGLVHWSAASGAPFTHTVSHANNRTDAGTELTRLVTGQYGVHVHARTSHATDEVLRDLTSLIR